MHHSYGMIEDPCITNMLHRMHSARSRNVMAQAVEVCVRVCLCLCVCACVCDCTTHKSSQMLHKEARAPLSRLVKTGIAAVMCQQHLDAPSAAS